jgi:hypothetical protein
MSLVPRERKKKSHTIPEPSIFLSATNLLLKLRSTASALMAEALLLVCKKNFAFL